MKYQVSTVCPTLLGVLCAVIQSASGLAKPSFQVSALPRDTYRYGTNNGDVPSRASMGCIATAMNITYFNGRWFNIKADGGERMLNDSDERIMIRNGNVFVADHVGTNAIINNLSYHDNGTYRCEIRENDATGAPISDWANATVDLILEVRLQHANNDSLVHTFNDSRYVELTCDMSGYIRLDEDLYWIIDGVEISSSGLKYKVSYRNGQNVAQFGGNSTIASRVTVLTVLDVALTDSSREYFCAIRNTTLIQRFILEVTPASRPSGYPLDVTVRPISSTVLEILWEDVPDDERNGNITHYEIIYTPLTTVPENEKTPTTFVTSGPVLSSLLRGLEEYTVYNVSVRAVTVVGPGPLSPTVTGQTLEDGK